MLEFYFCLLFIDVVLEYVKQAQCYVKYQKFVNIQYIDYRYLYVVGSLILVFLQVFNGKVVFVGDIGDDVVDFFFESDWCVWCE